MKILLKSWSTGKYAYAPAMGLVAIGVGLHFYYMREMLVSLALFSLLFFSLGLVALGVFFTFYAGNRAAIWAGPASRVVLALLHLPDREAELARMPADGWRLSDSRSEAQTQLHIRRKL